MPDVVIVGGGIAGGALSIVLAQNGIEVLALERSQEYEDRVRGEWLAPWGVAELQKLGLYDLLLEAGGNTLKLHTTFDETLDSDWAEGESIALDRILEGVPGPLCLGHPKACEVYEATARRAGVDVRRGVSGIRVEPGAPPTIEYRDESGTHKLTPRLIVGADGRDSSVRRQLGIGHHEDTPHHLFGGMLVENAPDFPEHRQVVATEGDRNFLAFPQGNGRVRLYAGYSLEEQGRFSGPEGQQRFVEACVMDCCPPSATLADAVPIGPCRSYKNSDTIAERIAAPGIVLVGDSAGHNDPLIGQGLSVTHRDVRLVRDALLASNDWSPKAFTQYADERRERMRRLRLAAMAQSKVETEFGEDARTFRKGFLEQAAVDPDLGAGIQVALAGPEAVRAELFDLIGTMIEAPERPAWPLVP